MKSSTRLLPSLAALAPAWLLVAACQGAPGDAAAVGASEPAVVASSTGARPDPRVLAAGGDKRFVGHVTPGNPDDVVPPRAALKGTGLPDKTSNAAAAKVVRSNPGVCNCKSDEICVFSGSKGVCKPDSGCEPFDCDCLAERGDPCPAGTQCENARYPVVTCATLPTHPGRKPVPNTLGVGRVK